MPVGTGRRAACFHVDITVKASHGERQPLCSARKTSRPRRNARSAVSTARGPRALQPPRSGREARAHWPFWPEEVGAPAGRSPARASEVIGAQEHSVCKSRSYELVLSVQLSCRAPTTRPTDKQSFRLCFYATYRVSTAQWSGKAGRRGAPRTRMTTAGASEATPREITTPYK